MSLFKRKKISKSGSQKLIRFAIEDSFYVSSEAPDVLIEETLKKVAGERPFVWTDEEDEPVLDYGEEENNVEEEIFSTQD
jgi:hypothetical protein